MPFGNDGVGERDGTSGVRTPTRWVARRGVQPMAIMARPRTVFTLREVLGAAMRGGYAVGAFSARYTAMIRPIVRAAASACSPAIIQISQDELERYGITPREMADEFYRAVWDEGIAVPLVLHLDQTRETSVIGKAIDAGFTSVMIDASAWPLRQNIALTRAVVDYAHARNVSVEAELGRVAAAQDANGAEVYADPDEAGWFVADTGIDALAVSVGTALGAYEGRKPRIDYDRLRAIVRRTSIPLVLHGGSGVPADMLARAIRLPGGGVSQVNIATDLELALLEALGWGNRMTNAECWALPQDRLAVAQAAVQRVVVDKIRGYLLSEGQARDLWLAGQPW